ncbi:hypothetical protein RHGRI_017236 [Rhododendron griersonianum]|uniref:GBF-interacting protein 1 N-terminal domain-containing protein n=1 Tax=Rhododendron griersonianum TaxID=479676 RepID=A0AAV6JX38_9ERIC|nr:hypothetical protein RHGRI_017236 [Rhododendron griersonianum]
MVQSLREIVNYPKPEIYAMLKECNLEPTRLLVAFSLKVMVLQREREEEEEENGWVGEE